MGEWLWVGLGGALGTLARAAMVPAVARWMGLVAPWGVLGVNLVGSLLMGALAGAATQGRLSPDLHRFWATGVLGGFTTYSAFNQALVEALSAQRWLWSAAYGSATVLGCLLLGALGFLGARHLGL